MINLCYNKNKYKIYSKIIKKLNNNYKMCYNQINSIMIN